MFTGIIETTANVKNIQQDGTNLIFTLKTPLAQELKIDQSVAHNGVCLTVVNSTNDTYQVVAVEETLKKTNLGKWQIGTLVNIERSMLLPARLDGHIVQGHVDQTAICKQIETLEGSWLFHFEYKPAQPDYITVEKGSICINGVSLTVFNAASNGFTVTIIPYTFEHTNFQQLQVGDVVNLEFDIIGKYIYKLLQSSGRI
jgi:riboflavin synthase